MIRLYHVIYVENIFRIKPTNKVKIGVLTKNLFFVSTYFIGVTIYFLTNDK